MLTTILGLLLVGLLFYIALGGLLFLFQRQLLYYPHPARPSAAAAAAEELRFWPAADDTYRGFLSRPPADPSDGTVVVFHGNAGRALDRGYYAHALAPLGYRVLLAEYPGYGGRPGRPGEAAFTADAKTTVERAYAEFGPPLYLWGESLGAGVAAAVAADPPVPIAGVVLITPWDSLPDLAQSIYWFYPVRRLVLDRFDNVTHLRTHPGPVAVVLAEEDEVVPIRHGLRLYEALTGERRLWILEGAGHNSRPVEPDAPWWREVSDYVATH